ncbi:hypothetical protein V1478_016766 [Vespula squamosa]|uniref:Uncharacterized protein n=1 Tax=Vespula squamosa TaxID=30214 RepID=A0ABD2A0P6_VESSQ
MELLIILLQPSVFVVDQTTRDIPEKVPDLALEIQLKIFHLKVEHHILANHVDKTLLRFLFRF